MTAKEAKEIILQRGYKEIWHNLPDSIKRSIEDAVNHMHVACEVDVSLLSELTRRALRRLGYTVGHISGTKYYICWTD